ncbi:protein Iojap-related, mitochondrial-like isoform X1 [Chenopodium quinoa]|uniref:protein Iojap-related, mitochondrial-like isoform X1 n=1 Tax=Chenopodium quinoa TaxID=63459 RepID=UPI000B777BB8|nr:protein Iojap-related, mitochondrial-like isoform X1 [Chenopodium quinoa]
MLSALRSRAHSLSSPSLRQPWLWKLNQSTPFSSLTRDKDGRTEILKLDEIEKVLSEVRADDIKVIRVGDQCDLTDYMVFATGRSSWHVRNIAQALVYKAKQKQKEAKRMLLPSVEGEESGNWIVVDSGSVIVHALDEKARAYYDLESRWAKEKPPAESSQELDTALVKVRRKNNSKKRVQANA